MALSLRGSWILRLADVGAPVSVRPGVFPPREESQIKSGPARTQHGTGYQVNRDVLLGGQRGIQDAETPEPTQTASQTAIAEVPGQAIMQMAEKTAKAAWREGQAFPACRWR